MLNQTLEEIEVIVVDDGSKDSTLEILKRYEQQYPSKLRVFHKEKGNRGIGIYVDVNGNE